MLRTPRILWAVLALTLALPIGAAAADNYKWPDKIPPEAADLLKPPPLSPRGQPVPGFPDGPPAT